jgi:hypothetical protein
MTCQYCRQDSEESPCQSCLPPRNCLACHEMGKGTFQCIICRGWNLCERCVEMSYGCWHYHGVCQPCSKQGNVLSEQPRCRKCRRWSCLPLSACCQRCVKCHHVNICWECRREECEKLMIPSLIAFGKQKCPSCFREETKRGIENGEAKGEIKHEKKRRCAVCQRKNPISQYRPLEIKCAAKDCVTTPEVIYVCPDHLLDAKQHPLDEIATMVSTLYRGRPGSKRFLHHQEKWWCDNHCSFCQQCRGTVLEWRLRDFPCRSCKKNERCIFM